MPLGLRVLCTLLLLGAAAAQQQRRCFENATANALARGGPTAADDYTLDFTWRKAGISSPVDAAPLAAFRRCELLASDKSYLDKFSRTMPFRARLLVSGCTLDEFSAAAFLDTIAGRTIVFVGDSVTEQHYHALVCALLAHARPAEWYPANATRGSLWQARSCVPFPNGAIVCLLTAAKLTEQLPPMKLIGARLRGALFAWDVVVANVGVHFHNVAMASAHWAALAGRLAPQQSPSTVAPRLIYRETGPQHFATGKWGDKIDEPGCRAFGPEASQHKNMYNAVVLPKAAAAGAALLRVWHVSEPHWSEHVGARDCTHYKQPGVIDAWNRILLGMLVGDIGLLRPLRIDVAVGERWEALRVMFSALDGCRYHDTCCSRLCRDRILVAGPVSRGGPGSLEEPYLLPGVPAPAASY
jgi:hypothetical protein